MKLYQAPSFYAHILNGILLVVAVVLLYLHWSAISRLSPLPLISLVLLLSVSVGVHGLSHAGLEHEYGFSPLA
jgi:tetrahydromethanopterin S-methyltransferase subunit E